MTCRINISVVVTSVTSSVVDTKYCFFLSLVCLVLSRRNERKEKDRKRQKERERETTEGRRMGEKIYTKKFTFCTTHHFFLSPFSRRELERKKEKEREKWKREREKNFPVPTHENCDVGEND